MKTTRVLRLFLPLLLALVSCELIDPSPGPKSGVVPGPPANRTVDVSIGARLYDQLCARCHGDSAQGTEVAATLQGISGIAQFVSTGRGAMPAFPELSGADIASIELFLKRFSAAFDTLSGGGLFHSACARCHGDSAQGLSGLGPGVQQAVNITATVRNGKGDMPAFTGLTDAQIASLEVFLAGVVFERTGKNLYNRYCVRCHGDDARGTPQYRTNIRRELEDIYEAVRRGKDRMPAFPELSTADVTLIRNYIQSLP